MSEPHDPVLASVPLSQQWPTLDPFLFCAHHNDAYPAGDGTMAPAASLGGRAIGSDFSDRDGWSMYHGSTVPGFPQHPHRGFETITFARKGLIDHADSLGATARFGRGDVQWMTAGSGIVHAEMFPLVKTEEPNPTELFQVWLNLPAVDKMVDPYFTMLWDETIQRLELDGGGSVTVIAGRLDDVDAPTPPPNSWAARDEANIGMWHVVLPAGGRWALPPTTEDTGRIVYLYEGNGLEVGPHAFPQNTGVQVDPTVPVVLQATDEPVECLVLQGRPIGEPVAQHGPFVMNTREEIEQAFRDYRETEFGGWPWHRDDPVHDASDGRFAVHADGRREEAPA
ncbi:MAG: pirin family protein [Acidimicrobiales bacterium]|nr:pirin family protein [Acidimicrobiales bacterium]RZV46420.1 MAG: pirin family protein [Acidimicrobiales bacterium]